MEGKYGRLFTEDDVKRMLELAVLEGAPSPDEQIAAFDEKGWLTFAPDEPLFLLRGQDKAAPRTIGSIIEPARWSGRAPREREGKCYVAMCRIVESHPDHLSAAAAAAQAMADWQAAHPERVKVPD